MGNIQCIKCGLDAWGKCPKCRTVFTEKYEYEQTEEERACEHSWDYKESGLKCIYGCNYTSPPKSNIIHATIVTGQDRERYIDPED